MKKKIIIFVLIIIIILGASVFFINKNIRNEQQKNEINHNVSLKNIEDKSKGHLSSTPKEKTYKNTKEYTNMKIQGLKNISNIVASLDDLDKINAFQEYIGLNLMESTGKSYNTVDEFNDLLENTRKSLPDNIYALLNSSETINNKLFKIGNYGVIAEPVIKQFLEDIKNKSDNITYKFNEKEISKIEQFNKKYNLTDEEEKALKNYVY